ncbi:MAG: pallilysin-related adhesin [Treponema sp.]|jgi:hypothetical protein|nr:pallilysin-related adhesin [Treponema sp.]
MNRKLLPFTIIVFMLCTAGICVLVLRPGLFSNQDKQEHYRTRIIIPYETGSYVPDSAEAERMAWEDSVSIKASLSDGEIVISVLNRDFDGDSIEEQIVAFHRPMEAASPVYLSYIVYDEKSQSYRRLWNVPTAATRPGTVSLYTQDLTGNRNECILLTGMNDMGEQTMTIFQRDYLAGDEQPFVKIAELQIDGSIAIQETGRSLAYQQGLSNGQPFLIAVYGPDTASNNILDQMEVTYAFNERTGLYEQYKITRIPGSQIEQHRLKELLSGEKGVFENFIHDLWYYVSPQGTLDKSQYIYFDPANREIIFFGDETQQVFNWHQSSPTRYGLYVSSQNVSVTTMRRNLDIELESLDSIRLRVSEDLRLKIIVSASWNGSYRRAGTIAGVSVKNTNQTERNIASYIDAVYDSSLGRLRFFRNGLYELSSNNIIQKGRYVFFQVNGQNLLELRPEPQVRGSESRDNSNTRLIYLVDTAGKNDERTNSAPENLSLSRVRLGATGIQYLHEGQITLMPVEGI